MYFFAFLSTVILDQYTCLFYEAFLEATFYPQGGGRGRMLKAVIRGVAFHCQVFMCCNAREEMYFINVMLQGGEGGKEREPKSLVSAEFTHTHTHTNLVRAVAC